MQLVNPSWEIWEQEPELEGIYKQIERAARVCYKSEGNIKEGSAKKMVDALIKNQHTAMLEHGTVYLKIEDRVDEIGRVHYPVIKGCYNYNPYCKVVTRRYKQEPDEFQKEFCKSIPRTTEYITTNLRVLVENDWLDDLKFLCEPTEYHEKRITVKFITSIGITRELIRHRVFSFANESTRYCNYSNSDKFNSEITYIIPSYLNIPEGGAYWHDGIGHRVGANESNLDFGHIEKDANYDNFLFAFEEAEKRYLKLLKEGFKPQQAREVLPLATKSEIVMTGFIEDWIHFIFLRADDGTGPAHPDIKVLAVPLKEEFIKRGLL